MNGSRVATTGGFTLRRGTLSILGKQLDFTRGNATFRGDLIPELDLLAETTAGDVTATVAVTGLAAKPHFVFSSRPELPQNEILSRVLFEKPSRRPPPIQAVQFADHVASLRAGPTRSSGSESRSSLTVLTSARIRAAMLKSARGGRSIAASASALAAARGRRTMASCSITSWPNACAYKAASTTPRSALVINGNIERS